MKNEILNDLTAAPALAASQPRYTVGTLHYTRKELTVLFGWLLWGDFAFTFFESIFARFIPLYLKELHASNILIGVMTGSIAGVVNVLFAPNISQWSDRHRGPLGRRIPFLLWVTPITVSALIFIGFAPEIGSWLHDSVISQWIPDISQQTTILAFLCAGVVAYHLFNMVLVNSYNWLLRDVVPSVVMARFLSWFRIVNTISSFAFLWYVFPYVISHRKPVCVGIGLFYLAAFWLMCRQVKEGDYPPPVNATKRRGLFRSFVQYFKECLSVPLYRRFFIGYVLVVAATTSANAFLILVARESLGLSMDDVGKIFAWAALASAVAYVPVGWLCDRRNPILVTLLSLASCMIVSFVAYFHVHDRTGWLIYSVVINITLVGWYLGSIAMAMMLFPREEFGQFSSAMGVFGCGSLILSNYLAGTFIDLGNGDYRLIFMWSALFFALSLPLMLSVYRGWKQHGGPDHYTPPLPESLKP